MDKKVLLASFIFKDRINWFLNELETKHSIPKNTVFIYEIDDSSKYMVTFKFLIKFGERVNFKEIFPNATLVHKRGNAIYSINALNKLIEIYNSDNIGNINYKNVKINWELYQNKLLLIRNNNLIITEINRFL